MYYSYPIRDSIQIVNGQGLRVMKAHFINNEDDKVISKILIDHVPRVGDEARFGGAGHEKYYKVTLVVFVYDEMHDRVNIGCDLIS
jgi:hypothetical protein